MKALITTLFLFCITMVFPLTLTIAHLNDTHAHLNSSMITMNLKIDVDDDRKKDDVLVQAEAGGFARLATRIKEKRDANFLFLDAGDVFQGTLYFTLFQGLADVWFLNEMQLTAMCLGNHEFDKGQAILANFAEAAKFPLLSANIDISEKSPLWGKIAPYTIKEIDGDKVAVIGLTTEDTELSSSPGEGISFLNHLTVLKKTVSDLQKKGINKIIVLSHLGYEKDIALAKEVDGVDLVIGGHTHTLLGNTTDFAAMGKEPLGNYPSVVEGKTGVYVVQAWAFGKVLGNLQVTFNEAGVITKCEGQPEVLLGDEFYLGKNGQKITATENTELYRQIREELAVNPAFVVTQEDSACVTKLKEFSQQIELLNRQKVATIPATLYHVRIPGMEIDKKTLSHGSQVVPLVCQAMLEKVNKNGYTAEIALQNAGSVKTHLTAPQLTIGGVYELLPFGNTLSLLEISGLSLKISLLEGIRQALTRGGGAYPYVSGMSYTAVWDKASGYMLKECSRQGGELADRQTYRLVTNSFVANKGDGYASLATIKSIDTGFIDADAFIDYAKNQSSLIAPESTAADLLIAKQEGNKDNFAFWMETPATYATANIYDEKGEKIDTLTLKTQNKQGVNYTHWNMTDAKGNKLPNGIYFAEIQGKKTSYSLLEIK